MQAGIWAELSEAAWRHLLRAAAILRCASAAAEAVRRAVATSYPTPSRCGTWHSACQWVVLARGSHYSKCFSLAVIGACCADWPI